MGRTVLALFVQSDKESNQMIMLSLLWWWRPKPCGWDKGSDGDLAAAIGYPRNSSIEGDQSLAGGVGWGWGEGGTWMACVVVSSAYIATGSSHIHTHGLLLLHIGQCKAFTLSSNLLKHQRPCGNHQPKYDNIRNSKNNNETAPKLFKTLLCSLCNNYVRCIIEWLGELKQRFIFWGTPPPLCFK